MSRNHLTRRVGRVRALVIGASAAGSLALATALGLQVAAGEASTASDSSSVTATTGSSDTSSSTSGSTSDDGSGLVSGSSGDSGSSTATTAARDDRVARLGALDLCLPDRGRGRRPARRRRRDRRRAARPRWRSRPAGSVPTARCSASRPAGTTCRRCWPTWCARHWSPRGSATERSTRPWERRWWDSATTARSPTVRGPSARPRLTVVPPVPGWREPAAGRRPAVPSCRRPARPRGHGQGRRRGPDGGRDRRRARHRCPGQPRWRHRDVGPGTGRRLAGDGAGPARRRSPAGDPARGRRHRHLEHREAHLARDGRTLHHLVDPATGAPTTGPWRTVTVVATDCARANTASTGAIVKGYKAAGLAPWPGLPGPVDRPRGTGAHDQRLPAGGCGMSSPHETARKLTLPRGPR